MSKIIAIAGRPRAGKSTKAMELVIRALYPDAPDDIDPGEVRLLLAALRGSSYLSRLMVYDINREWGVGGALPSMDAFLKSAIQARDRLIVFEEATMFFDPTRGRSEELREMLVRRRHTGNALVLLFHALADIPLYVMRMLDVLILYKTQDSPDDLRRIRHLQPVMDLYGSVDAAPNLHAYGEYDFVERTSIFVPR